MTGAFSWVIIRQVLQEFGPKGPDFQNNSALTYEPDEDIQKIEDIASLQAKAWRYSSIRYGVQWSVLSTNENESAVQTPKIVLRMKGTGDC